MHDEKYVLDHKASSTYFSSSSQLEYFSQGRAISLIRSLSFYYILLVSSSGPLSLFRVFGRWFIYQDSTMHWYCVKGYWSKMEAAFQSICDGPQSGHVLLRHWCPYWMMKLTVLFNSLSQCSSYLCYIWSITFSSGNPVDNSSLVQCWYRIHWDEQ